MSQLADQGLPARTGLVEDFEAALSRVGGRVILTDLAGLGTAVAGAVWEISSGGEARALTAACWKTSEILALGLPDALARAGCRVSDGDGSATADIGLTWADRAVAATGSVMVTSGPDRQRSTTLLPPHNFVILEVSRLVATTGDLFRQVGQIAHTGGLPANVALITGPSRSADIEMDLSIGVHGPKSLTVFVIRDR